MNPRSGRRVAAPAPLRTRPPERPLLALSPPDGPARLFPRLARPHCRPAPSRRSRGPCGCRGCHSRCGDPPIQFQTIPSPRDPPTAPAVAPSTMSVRGRVCEDTSGQQSHAPRGLASGSPPPPAGRACPGPARQRPLSRLVPSGRCLSCDFVPHPALSDTRAPACGSQGAGWGQGAGRAGPGGPHSPPPTAAPTGAATTTTPTPS